MNREPANLNYGYKKTGLFARGAKLMQLSFASAMIFEY
jgi:hypothetical protein